MTTASGSGDSEIAREDVEAMLEVRRDLNHITGFADGNEGINPP